MRLQEYIDKNHNGNLSDFARAADLHPMNVSRYARGEVTPTGINLQKINDATNGEVTLADLLESRKFA